MMRGQKRRARMRVPVAGGRKMALRRAELLVPRAARAHLRAAAREGLLALASLCEAALRAVEGSARVTRQRIERIPVKGKR
jgi:hypothetical protein